MDNNVSDTIVTENQTKESTKELKTYSPIKNTLKTLFLGAIIGIISVIAIHTNFTDFLNKHNIISSKSVNISYVSGKIHGLGDLITSELNYSGIVHYKTNSNKFAVVQFFTSDEFVMTYNAQVKAGVDLTKADVSMLGNKIYVKLPRAEVKLKKIDPNTIDYCTIKDAWFGADNKQLALDAQIQAEKDMDSKVNFKDVLDEAENEATKRINSLLNSIMTDYEINVSFQNL